MTAIATDLSAATSAPTSSENPPADVLVLGADDTGEDLQDEGEDGEAGEEAEAAAEEADAAEVEINEPTLWQKGGWLAKVIKNEDDEGWAVAMYRVGDEEPALVGPWVMGRDKKNPKPLNPRDFQTLVKTATEVLERAASALRARLHKTLTLVVDDRRVRVDLDIAPDEDDPHAILAAFDDNTNEPIGNRRVDLPFALTTRSATEAVRAF